MSVRIMRLIISIVTSLSAGWMNSQRKSWRLFRTRNNPRYAESLIIPRRSREY